MWWVFFTINDEIFHGITMNNGVLTVSHFYSGYKGGKKMWFSLYPFLASLDLGCWEQPWSMRFIICIWIYICGEDLLGLFRSYVHMSTRALNYDLGQGSLGYGLTFVLYMCLSFAAGVERLSHSEHEARALWHWFHFFGCLSLSPLVVTWANGFVVVCCCWGGRVVVLCTCLLLPGCKVWLRLFSEGWAPVPPLRSLLSLLLLGVSLYLFVGRKRVLFCQSRRQVSSENHVFPFVRCVFHLMSLFPM